MLYRQLSTQLETYGRSPPTEEARMHLLLVALTFAFTALFWRQGHAVDRGQYENVPPEIRAWYKNAELTPQAKERFPFKKCCDHADVFRTKFSVNKGNGQDEWSYLTDEGAWKRIPPDVIHYDQTAPDGQPTLFIYSGKETCFFVGEGGI